ncbi:MAG: CopY/TcrY family copper transport repressor [Peptostreptococcus sp.]|uniref:CopY/TcrY family copper transport repressor n=1 Tax=Peptostreptococcus sp. TaxID=1262 RepID=UPI002FC8F178
MRICNCNITDAELEVMNILWEKDSTTSREVSSILEKKKGWKNTTVKTLLSRLVEKEFLETEKISNYFVYSPIVSQESTLEYLTRNFNSNICSKSVGDVIFQLIADNDLSSKDIAKLEKLLEEKAPNDNIQCNCIPEDH